MPIGRLFFEIGGDSSKLNQELQKAIATAKDAEITKTFFKTIQNKLHWAVTGKTAAEIIAERADERSRRWG
jgi:hypothetical protein